MPWKGQPDERAKNHEAHAREFEFENVHFLKRMLSRTGLTRVSYVNPHLNQCLFHEIVPMVILACPPTCTARPAVWTCASARCTTTVSASTALALASERALRNSVRGASRAPASPLPRLLTSDLFAVTAEATVVDDEDMLPRALAMTGNTALASAV